MDRINILLSLASYFSCHGDYPARMGERLISPEIYGIIKILFCSLVFKTTLSLAVKQMTNIVGSVNIDFCGFLRTGSSAPLVPVVTMLRCNEPSLGPRHQSAGTRSQDTRRGHLRRGASDDKKYSGNVFS